MQARDVMTRNVITVTPQTSIDEAVRLLSANDLSALPVVEGGRLVGVISEADLLHRPELGTERKYASWIEAVLPAALLARNFTEAHAANVGEIMKPDVVSASEDTPLGEIASLLERHRIKRIPIVDNGVLVGIVSRSNLIQALASHPAALNPQADADRAIRLELLSRLATQPWTDFGSRNVTVENGTVRLWGLCGSEAEHKALIVLAETTPGVTRVSDEMIAAW